MIFLLKYLTPQWKTGGRREVVDSWICEGIAYNKCVLLTHEIMLWIQCNRCIKILLNTSRDYVTAGYIESVNPARYVHSILSFSRYAKKTSVSSSVDHWCSGFYSPPHPADRPTEQLRRGRCGLAASLPPFSGSKRSCSCSITSVTDVLPSWRLNVSVWTLIRYHRTCGHMWTF